MKYTVVLWDFDGTLVNTSEGIFHSLRETFSHMGFPVPPNEVLQKFIGPPLMYSFKNFIGMPEEIAERAVNVYRDFYDAGGMYLSQPYPGVKELSERLKAEGIQVGVATLKTEKVAQNLLEYFKIDHVIDVCAGSVSDSDGGASKAQIIATALERLGHTDRSDVVLIGDTPYDAQGAREAGVDFIAASYGFGISPEEEKNSVFVAHETDDLMRFFFPKGEN